MQDWGLASHPKSKEKACLQHRGFCCRVMLESFVSTQKMSVQKALQKKFKRFINYKNDLAELLMSALHTLVRDHMRMQQLAGNATDTIVSIPCRCPMTISLL